MTLPSFRDLVLKLPAREANCRLLALDPGGTTGYAWFNNGILLNYGETSTPNTHDAAIKLWTYYIVDRLPDVVVCEEYRIYHWRAKHHAGSDLLTARIIGVIECICAIRNIPIYKQTAHIAKQFCTDAKLKAWDMYPVGQGHARDAVRHGAYFTLFGKSGHKTKRGHQNVG